MFLPLFSNILFSIKFLFLSLHQYNFLRFSSPYHLTSPPSPSLQFSPTFHSFFTFILTFIAISLFFFFLIPSPCFFSPLLPFPSRCLHPSSPFPLNFLFLYSCFEAFPFIITAVSLFSPYYFPSFPQLSSCLYFPLDFSIFCSSLFYFFFFKIFSQTAAVSPCYFLLFPQSLYLFIIFSPFHNFLLPSPLPAQPSTPSSPHSHLPFLLSFSGYL